MANEDYSLRSNEELIQALTPKFDTPTNGNGQNTAVASPPRTNGLSQEELLKAQNFQNKAIALQNFQNKAIQAKALKEANEAFSKNLSIVPPISLPDSGFQFREEPSTDVALPKTPTEEDMLKPLGPQPPDPALVQLADQAALTNNVPQAIFKQLIKQESSWNPRAQSNAGAMGLGQFMPDTATKDMGLTLDKEGGPGSVWHPESNLNASAKYLRAGFDRYTKQGFSPIEAWKI
ncbi:uncharacterized protein METZ01_LOCUS440564, partial [marine metagenome]